MTILQLGVRNKYSPVPHWRLPLLYLCMAYAGLFALYSGTLSATISKWVNSDTYAHGMLVGPLSLYMIWTRRRHLSLLTPRPTLWGGLVILFAVLIWLVGSAISVLVIQQLAVLVMIWAIAYGILGAKVVKKIAFPLAFLFFAVPMGEELIPALMDITAVFTVKLLQFTGLPVYREGLYFAIPSGNFEVAKACSGIRYLSASLTIGCIFAYLNYQTVWRRVVFILISILLPILANSIRAYGIVMIAHLSDMKYALGVDHVIYGWLFFGLIMFLLFYIGNKWREPVAEVKGDTPPRGELPVSQYRYAIVLVAMIAVAAYGPLKTSLAETGYRKINAEFQPLPDKLGEWKKRNTGLIDWKPEFRGASHQLKAVFADGKKLLQIYIAYYEHETQHAELINQVNKLYDTRAWVEIQNGRRTVKLVGERRFTIQQKTLKSGQDKRILWYWYDLDGYATQNIYAAKLFQAWKRMIAGDRGGAIIAVSLDLGDEDDSKSQAMLGVLTEMYPLIESRLTELRNAKR